jgi:hypothetical protein
MSLPKEIIEIRTGLRASCVGCKQVCHWHITRYLLARHDAWLQAGVSQNLAFYEYLQMKDKAKNSTG